MAELLARTAVGETGAPGGGDAITGALGSDALLEPLRLMATTLNVYDTPFVSPVIAQLSADVVWQVRPPGLAVNR